ncbi:C80 family cysteine peptidase [Arsenophonus apicola]|uniref:C80 family cysteine peptidase n=1 Tax=Arsenophonus apicola TaxID=2879119 RepID=A0ABY8P6A6_9GAMM|nr:C80 family cysteine peptidase [Arsenophonus apicola]WGO84624.1 C80 family cysteine peptidase [Arsenophonus apicola]
MPANYNPDINFSHNTYLYLMAKDRLVYIAEKFVLHGDKNKLQDIKGSFAIGLSIYYMAHVRQGGKKQGEKFLLGLNDVINIIEMPISDNSPSLMKAKLMAEKIHAKEKLDSMLAVVIDIQKRYLNSIDINNYVSDPYMWLDMLPAETAHHYIDRVTNRALELNNSLKNATWFAELCISLKARYFNSDSDSIDNIKDNFLELLSKKKYDYYIDSIRFTLDNGVQAIKFSEKDDRHYYFFDIDYFFKKHLDDPAKYNAQYFEVFASDHVMILSIESEQDKINYSFFDSNIGAFNFVNKEKFKSFFISFLQEHEKSYHIVKNESNNYQLKIAAYKDNDDIKHQLIDLNMQHEVIEITAAKIIFEQQEKFATRYIIREHELYPVDFEFIDIDFINKFSIIKLTATVDNKTVIKKVVIQELSIDEILNTLSHEVSDLFYLQRDMTLIKYDRDNIIYYDFNDTININQQLSEIANNKKLPYLIKKNDDFLFMQDYVVDNEDNESVFTMDTVLDDKHTVIIQIQDDSVVSNGVERLKNKHPENTTVIFFDIRSHKHQVMHNSTALAKEGNVRWLIAAHGSYFNELSPDFFATSLQNLKSKLFDNHDPQKIIFLSCKQANNNIVNDNGFKFSRALWSKGFSSTMAAYTENIYISDSGHRMARVKSFDKQTRDMPAQIYKNIYQYHQESGIIFVNEQDYIFALLDSINHNHVLDDTLILENYDYLKKYFVNKNGQLDIDLIRLVSYENEAYQIFKSYYHEIINNNLIFDSQMLISKLRENAIFEIPIWRKVNSDFILADNSHIPITGKKNIILRFAGDNNARQQAELIAAQDPQNTLVAQIDTKRKKYFIEYGNLTDFQSRTEQHWLLLGQVSPSGRQFSGLDSQQLSQSLITLKEELSFNNPQEISIISTSRLGQHSNPFRADWIVSGLAKQLSAADIDTILTFYTHKKSFLVNQNLLDYHDSFFYCRYDRATKQILLNEIPITQALLMCIALKEISIWQATTESSFYLQNYFTDKRGNIDENRLKQALYDPVINKKINLFFQQNYHISANAMDYWQKIFIKNISLPIWQQADELSLLLDAIYDDHSVLHHLSDRSRWILRQYFSLGANEIDQGKIFRLIANYPEYLQLQTALSDLIGLSSDNGLEGLSLQMALEKSSYWHKRILINFSQLRQQVSHSADIEGGIRLFPHAFLLHDHNISAANIAATLGAIYAYSIDYNENFHQLLVYHRKLYEQRLKHSFTSEELHFLQQFEHIFNNIKYKEMLGNTSQFITTQSLEQWLSTAVAGRYQLKAGNLVFTLSITQQADNYQYALFDAKSGEIKLSGQDKRNISTVLCKGLTAYLTVDLPKNFIVNNKTTRAAEMGITKNAVDQFEFDIYRLNLDPVIKNEISSLLSQLPAKSESTALPLTVKVGAIDIQLATLQQAGAQIDNKLVTSQSVNLLSNHPDKLTFDVQQLNDYLTFASGSQQNSKLVSVIKQQLNQVNATSALLANQQNLASSALLLERLSDIKQATDIDRNLWPRFQQNSLRLPRYARMMNKIGYGTQAIGLFQLVNSTQMMLAERQSLQLTDEQRSEIDKNIIIAWSATGANFSTDILQPLLLKMAYKATGSYQVAGTFTGRAVIFLNAIAAGFDVYYAYENFNQLATEQDADVRQDLIVNGTLSLLGAGISVGTAFAILVGSSVAGPISIAIGAALMLGGMTYNAGRAVEKIKQKVGLTSEEEFETGLRVALGLNLTYAIQNRLQQYQIADTFKQALLEKQRNQFEDMLKPAGYNLHFYIEEEQQVEELPYFHLIDKQTNEYIAYQDIEELLIAKNISLLSNSVTTLWTNDKIDFAIEQNKRRFSEAEVKLILQQFPLRYEIEVVKIKEYIPTTYTATDEIILLAPDHDNILSNFGDIVVEQKRIFTSNSKNSKVLYFTALNNQYDHNYDLIENYLAETYQKENISAVSFNTANGNDVIIGLDTLANRFEIFDGKKIFIAGNKDDIFILNNRQFKINEIKHLYGKEGNDSIIINTLPIQQDLGLIEPDFSVYNKHNNTSFFGSYIDLENNTVKYLKRPFQQFEYSHNIMKNFINSSSNTSQLVASINNFENASGPDKAHNIIIGNEKDNILSGGNGHAILHGGEGNDALLLAKGYANGGNGVDRYVIQRYNWMDHIKILPDYRLYNQWDAEQQIFISPNQQKPQFKFNRLFNYHSKIVIDEEGNNSETIVELEYQLDEIKLFALKDSDIIIKIEIAVPSELNKVAKSDIEIKLKNAYGYYDNGKHFLTHQYHIRTQDGFILVPYLPQSVNLHIEQPILYEAMYVRRFERNVTAARPYFVAIDLAENSIETYKKIYHLPDNIRPMQTTFEAVETIFSGDRHDNYFYNIKSDSYFHITKGVDHYYISDMSILNLVSIYITFDYDKISEYYTDNDRIIIYLAEYSGYDFFFYNNELVHKDKKNDIARIKFINWQPLDSINILIQDKNQQKFNIILSEQGNFIVPLDPIQMATEQDDIIVLPLDFRMNDKLLDAGDGNDIVTDVSEKGHIIKGGKGNDIITVKGGYNILLDGEGDDALYGGDDDDILISNGGNVTLAAGKGNNIIFINQLNGSVKIINNGGKDTIILQDKKIADYQMVDHNGNRSYLSSDGLSSIVIENYDQQNVVINAAIGQGETLNNKQLDSLIDFIAAFDPTGENGSINLITYLPTFNIDLNFSVATTI